MFVYAFSNEGVKLLKTAMKNEGYCLEEVYTKASQAKHTAYNRCFDDYMSCIDAHDFRICSHNTDFFSVAWDCEIIHPKTGEIVPATIVRTYANRYVIYYD